MNEPANYRRHDIPEPVPANGGRGVVGDIPSVAEQFVADQVDTPREPFKLAVGSVVLDEAALRSWEQGVSG